MLKGYKIRAPYFEIGPKCFMWGERMLKLAKAVDKGAAKYDLDVIITPSTPTSVCLLRTPNASTSMHSIWMLLLPVAALARFCPNRSRKQAPLALC